MDTIRSLEEALLEFAGCAIVVSHDRYFLDRICTHIMAYEGNGVVNWFTGNYQEYAAWKAQNGGGGGEAAADPKSSFAKLANA